MKALYKALADFQQEIDPIYKGTAGYGYKYADWGEILKAINPLLKKHGLGFTQPLNGTSVKTIVFHVESGESIESEFEIPQGIELKGMNAFQVLGSGITYLRRYSLSSALGLVTDEDADASGQQTGKANKADTKAPTAPRDETQRAILANLLRQHGKVEKDDILDFLQTEYGIKVVKGEAQISPDDMQMIIKDLDIKGQ